ncbi:MAG: porin family protein [Kordiimonadaceae bacterium]|jgi:OmpA-OmpF porin, OOP family|nr:porin family protein [Kordiimonadaceae bacterium]
MTLRKIVTGIFVLGIFAATAAWNPSQANNVYISLQGGGALLNESNLSDNAGNTADVDLKTGYIIGGSVGYRFKMGARIEAQFNHQKNDISSASALGVSVTADGDATINSRMANFFYDFKTKSPKWSPYIGAGIGVATVNVSDPSVTVGNITLTGNDVDDTVFAYQGMVGLGFNATEKVTISGEYRYFGSEDPTFTGIDASVDSHNFLVGLRFNF